MLVLQGHVPSGWGSGELGTHSQHPTLPPAASYYITVRVRLLITVCFSLQCWWENPIPSFRGCEEYLSKHLHLQPWGRCLRCQRILQRFPGTLLHQHVAEGRESSPERSRLLSPTPAGLLCSMGCAMSLQKPLLDKGAWSYQKSAFILKWGGGWYSPECLPCVVFCPFSLVDRPSLSGYSFFPITYTFYKISVLCR